MISDIYVIETIIILMLSIIFNFHNKLKKMNKDVFLIISMVIAFLVFALRGISVGVDTRGYHRFFNIIDILSWKDALKSVFVREAYSTEIGYTIWQKIVGIFFDNSQWIIVMNGIVYIYCMYFFIKKTCEDKIMAIFVFLCTGTYLLSFNMMRQAMGVGICCVAWVMLQENKKHIAILLMILACSIHMSSIVMFIMFFIKKLPSNKRMFKIFMLGAGMFILFGNKLIDFVLNFFPVYQARYGKGRWDVGELNGILILWFIIAMLMVLIYFTTNWKVEKKHYDFEVIVYSLLFLMANIVGQGYDGFGRVSMFFQPFLIILFDIAKRRINRKTQYVYVTGVVLSCSLLFLRMASTAQYQYVFFFE